MPSATSNEDKVPTEDLAALHLSQATNHVYNFDFSRAHIEAKKGTPGLRLLHWQEKLLWDQMFCVGRITRGEGLFQEARRCFEACMNNTETSEAKRLLVKSAVADIYCELAHAEEELSYLAQAGAVLEPEVERLRQSSRHQTKGFWRLLLSLTEVRIRQDRRNEAGVLATELLTIYQSIKYPELESILQSFGRGCIHLWRGLPSFRYSLGIMVNTKDDLGAIQRALQTWKNSSCIDLGTTVVDWQSVTYPVPSLLLDSTNSSTANTTQTTQRRGILRRLSARDDDCTTIQVHSGDSCSSLAAQFGISLSDFIKYNPSSNLCPGLVEGQHTCYSSGRLPDFKPKPDSNGYCHKYLVKAKGSCSSLAAANRLTNEKIEEFN